MAAHSAMPLSTYHLSRRKAGATAVALAALALAPLRAQPRGQQPLPPQPAAQAVGVAADAVERFVLPSPWRRTGWRIQVWTPSAAPPPGGHPVIYALDGNAVFESLVQAGRDGSGHAGVAAVVVGVGYDVAARNDARARAWDYTPPSPDADAPRGSPHDPSARGRSPPGGGADRFLAWLQDELQPRIASRYPVDAARSTLYGHSFGGLFVLHVLFTHPHAFRSYVAASPSLWWNGGVILREARQFAARPAARPGTAPRRLLLLVGGQESPGSTVVLDRFHVLLALLRQAPGLLLQEQVFPELGHGAMLPASLGPALRWGSE